MITMQHILLSICSGRFRVNISRHSRRIHIHLERSGDADVERSAVRDASFRHHGKRSRPGDHLRRAGVAARSEGAGSFTSAWSKHGFFLL